jgi:hypothetical protein
VKRGHSEKSAHHPVAYRGNVRLLHGWSPSNSRNLARDVPGAVYSWLPGHAAPIPCFGRDSARQRYYARRLAHCDDRSPDWRPLLQRCFQDSPQAKSELSRILGVELTGLSPSRLWVRGKSALCSFQAVTYSNSGLFKFSSSLQTGLLPKRAVEGVFSAFSLQ